MFTSLRAALLLGTATVMIVGILIASAVINATSGSPTPVLTSAAAIARATRSLPAFTVVAPGDTFTTIAARNHLTVDQLQELNPRQDPNALLAGQRLRLHMPAPGTTVAVHAAPAFWIVRRGDTYSSIAAQTGVAIADIAQFNPSVDPNLLRPGRRLRLRP